MRFESLHLRGFRNYADLKLAIPEGVVVFHGPNGQGKTNLMEAFHFLLRGESFRPVASDSLLRHHEGRIAEAARLDARLDQNDLKHDIRVSFTTGKKAVVWNHQNVSASSLARAFPVVLFSPESLSAIKDGPEARRHLVDDLLLTQSNSSVKVLKDFNRALKTRNRVLRDCKRGLTTEKQAYALLESLDPSFIPLATELTVARLTALQALHSDFEQATKFVLDSTAVDISVEYVISQQNAYTWSRSEILSAMHNRALELRAQELASGLSLVGPQRHDVRILFSGKDSRFFCSQGQQRALILSFKMAQILYHHRAYQVYPFLLLDDVLSELDPRRRANLVEFLKGIPAQIFITTTDLTATDLAQAFGDRRIHLFRIERGVVTPESTI